MSWCNLDLSSDLAIMTLTCKIFSRLYLGNCKGTKLILGTPLVECCKCATSWCNLHLAFDLAVVTFIFKIMFSLCLGNRMV